MEIALRVHVVWRILSNISGYTGPIFTIFSPYESALRADDGPLPCFPISQRDVAMATKSFVNVRYNTAKKLAYFVKYFPHILDLFSQSFHRIKALYVQMMDLYFFSKFGQLPST